MRVEVYWNLSKKCWSVRHPGGRLIEDEPHRACVELRDVTWVVQPGGRKRVLRKKRKNVHAFARGTLVTPSLLVADLQRATLITYNPYREDRFVTCIRRTPVEHSEGASLLCNFSHPSRVVKPTTYALGETR